MTKFTMVTPEVEKFTRLLSHRTEQMLGIANVNIRSLAGIQVKVAVAENTLKQIKRKAACYALSKTFDTGDGFTDAQNAFLE